MKLETNQQKTVALVLALFVGTLGIHRMYTGDVVLGIVMLLLTLFGLFPVTLIWCVVDCVIILLSFSNEK